MKTRFCSAIAVVCLAFAAPAAFAAPITVEVTARVSQINDPYQLLGGQVSLGQTGSGRYTYETSVPDGNIWSSQEGNYTQFASEASLAFTLGALNFETDPAPPYWMFQVWVWDSQPDIGGQDYVRIYGSPYKPLLGLPGITVWQVMYEFADFNGSALTSDALPAGAPNLAAMPWSRVRISGGNGSGYANFEITLDILSVRVGGGGEFTVSPEPGMFVRQQPIVPALLLPAGTQVAAIEGSFNGFEMPGYFSSCSRAYTADPRIVFVCPDLNNNLLPGANKVEWRVRMTDGSVSAKFVGWEIVQ